jgi:hypothetical protein
LALDGKPWPIVGGPLAHRLHQVIEKVDPDLRRVKVALAERITDPAMCPARVVEAVVG